MRILTQLGNLCTWRRSDGARSVRVGAARTCSSAPLRTACTADGGADHA